MKKTKKNKPISYETQIAQGTNPLLKYLQPKKEEKKENNKHKTPKKK